MATSLSLCTTFIIVITTMIVINMISKQANPNDFNEVNVLDEHTEHCDIELL